MNYTVYDTTMDSPSMAERDILWSVLLFGNTINFISNYSPAILIYEKFPQYAFDEKLIAYAYFRPMVEPFIKWSDFLFHLNHILEQRRKKNKTSIEVKDLAQREVWLRNNEKWFMTSLSDNLHKYQYQELPALKDAGIHATWAVPDPEENPLALPLEQPLTIITNALAQADNLFVFDERIKPYIEGVPTEKVLSMPLCFALQSNEIQLARNELKQNFQAFHECIHTLTKDQGTLQEGMGKLKALVPSLQGKINDNVFISKALNQQATTAIVDLHLGFTSVKGMLTILEKREILNKEEVLKATEIMQKESNLDALKPFIYLTH